MKMYLLCFQLCVITFLSVEGQQNSNLVHFSGQINSDLDSVKLLVAFNNNYISGGRFESEWINIPVDRNGKFYFSLSCLNNLSRIYIVDRVSTDVLFTQEQQIVEPGDSIFFRGTIHDREEPYYFTGKFSGKGAGKYECIQALKSIDDERLRNVNIDLPLKIRIRDSLLAVKLALLNTFKKQMSAQVYEIIKSDMTGDIDNDILMSFSSIFYQKLSQSEMIKKRQAFEKYIKRCTMPASNKALAFSVGYSKFLYEKEKAVLAFIYNGYNFHLKALYDRLSNEYTGILREKLLTHCLLNDTDLYGIFSENTSEKYSYCLKNAISVIQTPLFKQSLENRLIKRGKGAVAYNFTLPVDSSNRKLSLSDLKGKVILLDMWGYTCTGCTLFAKSFHEKVHPLFKDNPNFTVVSVMLGETSKTAYMRRLRQEEGVIYTYPDNINLFGGSGEEAGRAIEKYYSINAFPFILLIDKRGKIYSSTIPFFTQPNSPNVHKLIALIKKALNES